MTTQEREEIMPFDLKSFKESLLVVEDFVNRENKILIEDLGLPEWFDYRRHDLYLPSHMKDQIKGEIPSFVKFSAVADDFGHMIVVDKGFPYSKYKGILE